MSDLQRTNATYVLGLLSALLLMGNGVSATAGIVGIGQSRTVTAVGNVSGEGGGDSEFDSASASGFTRFNDAVGLSLSYSDPVYAIFGGVNGIASQDSVIGSHEISASLIADASAGVTDFEFFSASAGGSTGSQFFVTFEITARGLFQLTTSSPLVFDFGDVFFQFRQDGNLLAETYAGGESLDLIFDLMPGVYEIDSVVSAFPFAFGEGFQAGRGELQFAFTELRAVPEPSSAALLIGGLIAFASMRRKCGQE